MATAQLADLVRVGGDFRLRHLPLDIVILLHRGLRRRELILWILCHKSSSLPYCHCTCCARLHTNPVDLSRLRSGPAPEGSTAAAGHTSAITLHLGQLHYHIVTLGQRGRTRAGRRAPGAAPATDTRPLCDQRITRLTDSGGRRPKHPTTPARCDATITPCIDTNGNGRNQTDISLLCAHSVTRRANTADNQLNRSGISSLCDPTVTSQSDTVNIQRHKSATSMPCD